MYNEVNVKYKICEQYDVEDAVYFIYDSSNLADEFNVLDQTVFMQSSKHLLVSNTDVNIRSSYIRLYVAIEKYGRCTIILNYVTTLVFYQLALQYSCLDTYSQCRYRVSSIDFCLLLSSNFFFVNRSKHNLI